MIQELLGGSNVGITGGRILNSAAARAPQYNVTPAAAAMAVNLRCPRCDSTNTKFCYYNNYNLTQPRHFCKTCRRYWTKGGALRNVPIGGGCRKNKNAAAVTVAIGKSSSSGKMKTAARLVNYKNALLNVFDQSPKKWETSQYSHFLSLLRDPNPNTCGTGSVHSRILDLDPPGPTRLPTNSYPEYAPILCSKNIASTSGSAFASAILESAPVGSGDVEFWNPALLWTTDLATTNGAFPCMGRM